MLAWNSSESRISTYVGEVSEIVTLNVELGALFYKFYA